MAQKRGGGNGDPRDQVWRVHVLCSACLYQPVAHICLGGCQICSAGATEKEGTNINTHYCFIVSNKCILGDHKRPTKKKSY